MPLQVDVAFAGGTQGEHELPHELTSELFAHVPAHT